MSESVAWQCLTCEEKPTFENRESLIKHLTDLHAHVPCAKATLTPKLFLDGAKGFHQQQYVLDFGKYQVLQTWTSRSG